MRHLNSLVQVSEPGAGAVFDALKAARAHPDDVPAVAGPGVYALFGRRADCLLPEIALPEDRLLYVGESSDLRERDHFAAQHSGFSSPRRSLGAILKARLGLTAIPCASRASKINRTNFRFAGDGEQRLSEWMMKNLDYAVFPSSGDVKELEARLIEAHGSPLNVKGWQNPQARAICRLRGRCREEARRFDGETG